MNSVALAFAMTFAAGLATGVGSTLAIFTRRTNTRFLSLSLGFSAGVMIYVSFVEILSKARESLSAEFGASAGSWAAACSFFTGIVLTAVIDRLVPAYENPHETRRVEDLTEEHIRNSKLMRMGLLSAIVITMHNLPEGLATFFSALREPTLGISVMIAVALHNIPEGIAVAVPVYFATGSRRTAFLYSFLSGMAEPVGAALGYFMLQRVFGHSVTGLILGLVAGIMVFISLDELLPTAREYGEHHLAAYGLIVGMGFMAVVLLLMP